MKNFRNFLNRIFTITDKPKPEPEIAYYHFVARVYKLDRTTWAELTGVMALKTPFTMDSWYEVMDYCSRDIPHATRKDVAITSLHHWPDQIDAFRRGDQLLILKMPQQEAGMPKAQGWKLIERSKRR